MRVPTRRVGGRIRSEDARADVLGAVVETLEESGYGAVTIEGVAARSGVAKSTIYRWWSSKPDLVMEAYTRIVADRMPPPDPGDPVESLVAFVAGLYRVADHPARVRALKGLMAEAQVDAEFAERFRAWVLTRRAALAAILVRGQEQGLLPAELDRERAADLVFGPFWYRLLVDHAPLHPAEARQHVAQVLDALR